MRVLRPVIQPAAHFAAIQITQLKPIYPAFEKQVLDIAQAQRKPDIHHGDETDDLGRGVEIPERIGGFAKSRLGLSLPCINRLATGAFGLTGPVWVLPTLARALFNRVRMH
jgi:hypothetical protein